MAGGFFSGGSSDSVNASVAEAERAAREAEAAATRAEAAVADLTPFTGQTDAGDYTVPPAVNAEATRFLNQAGDWLVPVGGSDQNLSAGIGITITDDEINVANPFTDTDETKLDGIEEGAQVNVAPTKAVIDALGVDAATVDGFTVGVDVPANAVFAYTAGDGLTLTGTEFTRDDIALTGLSDIPTPVASNFLQRNADDDGYVWSASAATVAALTDIGDIPTTIASTVLARNSANDGYEWVVDSDVPYTGSDGITLTDQDFTLTDNGVGADKLNVADDGLATQFLRSDGDGSFTWAIPTDTDTTYTAGTGLDLTGTVFSIPNDGVDTAQIADSAVETAKINDEAVTSGKLASEAATANKIAANAVTTIKIADDAVTAAKLADDAVVTDNIVDANVTRGKIADSAVNESKLEVSNTGASGEFLQSDGDGTFTWAVPAGNGTTYTADGDTLTLTGTEFSVTPDGIDTTELADDAVTTAKIADNAVTSNSIMDNNVGADELNVSGDGTSGQFLASDGDGTFTWTTGSTTLQGLTDTNIPASITDRRFLEYSPSEDVWDAVSISDLLNISDLFDVVETNLQDNQFLRYETSSAKWVNETVTIPGAVAAGTGISVSGSTVSVTADGINNALLADNAVRTENIVNAMVTNAKIADDAVDTDQILNDAVTTAKIADNAITATQVAPNSLGATELATDSVSSFKLQDNAVISGKIADNTVGADELDVSGDGTSGQVLSSDGDGTFSWVANGSGGATYTAGTGLDLSDENQFSIADQGVGTSQIANNAVTGTQVTSGAIDTAELADNAVTNVKMADNSVDTAEIVTGAVTNVKIATGAVMTGSIGSDAVTTVKVIDNAITSGKLATDIPISTFSDVNTTGVNNGQILTYNGTTWVPTNNSGGGNTDNSRLGITLNPSSLNEGDEATSITVTLAIVNAISDEMISGQSVTVTDPTGHSVAVSGSGNSFTFMASTANNGNFVIRASATFTTGGTSTVHSSSANLPVHADNANWFQTISATAPTAVSGMTDNGIYSSPENATFQSGSRDTNARKAYIAAPTRSGGYAFTLGVFPASDVTEVSTLGDYTLYRINDADFDDRLSGTLIITITES